MVRSSPARWSPRRRLSPLPVRVDLADLAVAAPEAHVVALRSNLSQLAHIKGESHIILKDPSNA